MKMIDLYKNDLYKYGLSIFKDRRSFPFIFNRTSVLHKMEA